MRKSFFKVLVLVHLLLTYSYVSGSEYFADDDKPGTIKGVIVDNTTGQAMEYANIAIYNKEDSTLVTGGITGNNGTFEIKGMPLGEYYLEAHFIGFEKTKVDEIVLDRESPVFNSGSINLSPSAIEIGSELATKKWTIS